MKTPLVILLIVAAGFGNAKTVAESSAPKSDITFYDALLFDIQGKYHPEKNYYRLPAAHANTVRKEVWELSKNSAGVSVRFATNSTYLSVRWKIARSADVNHMNRIGVSGIDVYCFVDDKWQYVNSGIPSGTTTTALFMSNMDTVSREFMINLPLYSNVESVEIGVDKNAAISTPVTNTNRYEKPIVFYGTSITQGGSASRPGMAYPAIIARKYLVETINFGFSGNGFFERSVGNILCEIDPLMYVIDCTPNSLPDTIRKNALNLVKQLRDHRPDTPILLVESIIRENSFFNGSEANKSGSLKCVLAQNDELKRTFEEAKELGIKNLFYLESNGLLGYDHDGTVDGTHVTDLGFYRMSEVIGGKISKILKFKPRHHK